MKCQHNLMAFAINLAKLWQIMSIRIYLTGRVALEVDGVVVLDERRFRGRQGRLVFAYMVCHRTRAVSREELAILLWPKEMSPSWSIGLSAVISRFRGILSSDALRNQGVSLSRGLGQYRLILPSDAWVDLESGVSAIDRAESAMRNDDYGSILGPATVAATIARRSFLSGVSGHWVESQRRRQERQLIRALDCLSSMRLHTNEPDLAVESSIEAISLDPYRESSYQLLMHAYLATGNRAEALSRYHHLRELLADELGTEPSPETESVYLKLLG